MAVSFDDLIPQNKAQAVTFDDLIPQEKGFVSGVKEDLRGRMKTLKSIKEAQKSGQQGYGESLYQTLGGVTLGTLNDILGQGFAAAGRGVAAITPDVIKQPIAQGAGDVASYIGSSAAGDLARNAAAQFSGFEQENPRAARNIRSGLNIGLFGLSATPVKGTSAISGSAQAIGAGAKLTGKAAKATITAPLKLAKATGIRTGALIDTAAEKIGKNISEDVIKYNLPKNLRNLPKPEALFLRELRNEGLSLDDAYQALAQSKALGVSPSIAAAADIPSMKAIGGLMAGGSKGSRVAAKALDDIENIQIPKLNEKIIAEASGGKVLGAENYGAAVSKMAKDSIQAQANKLKTRAAPFYAKAIGVDKSIDIQNPLMQKALSNPLVVKALDDFRADPFTLTNVKRELGEFGVDASQLEKIPYNSTVALHSARTHLRSMGDAAFAAGEKQKGKAIKDALSSIDEAIESQFPDYKTARKIYSEDAGALKILNESPMGQMARMGEGDLSKIANSLASKDPEYINKFFARAKSSGVDEQKFRDAVAGSYLKRKLEDASKGGLRFSDAVLKNETSRKQLRSIVGDDKFKRIEAINKVIDELNETRGMAQGSRTALLQSIRDESAGSIPTSRGELMMKLRGKYAPSLVDMVKNNPQEAARFNELLFTDEGFKLIESMRGTTNLTVGDQNKLAKFFSKKKVK